MTKQELIEKLSSAVDGAIVLVRLWYEGIAPVSTPENNDNWCNLMDAKQHIAALESLLTVKGEPGEAIERLKEDIEGSIDLSSTYGDSEGYNYSKKLLSDLDLLSRTITEQERAITRLKLYLRDYNDMDDDDCDGIIRTYTGEEEPDNE